MDELLPEEIRRHVRSFTPAGVCYENSVEMVKQLNDFVKLHRTHTDSEFRVLTMESIENIGRALRSDFVLGLLPVFGVRYRFELFIMTWVENKLSQVMTPVMYKTTFQLAHDLARNELRRYNLLQAEAAFNG